MYSIGTKLGVSEFFYTHVGRYIGNGQVIHNHWRNGAEIISLEDFANGKTVKVMDQGVLSLHDFMERVKQVLCERKPYHLVSNNCEHTASYVSTGTASSPQLAFYGGMTLLAGVYLWSRHARA